MRLSCRGERRVGYSLSSEQNIEPAREDLSYEETLIKFSPQISKGGQFDSKGRSNGEKTDYSDGREYLWREPRKGDRTTGSNKGGRDAKSQTQSAPVPIKHDDFPALPGAKTKSSIASWADQVEEA